MSTTFEQGIFGLENWDESPPRWIEHRNDVVQCLKELQKQINNLIKEENLLPTTDETLLSQAIFLLDTIYTSHCLSDRLVQTEIDVGAFLREVREQTASEDREPTAQEKKEIFESATERHDTFKREYLIQPQEPKEPKS